MNVDHINPFLAASTKILKEMCGIEAAVGKPFLKEPISTEDAMIIIIGVTGEMRGQVMISFSQATTLDIASRMMMTEVTEISDMVHSAIGELGNMIMGNAATILAYNQILVDITPPTIGEGRMIFSSYHTQNVCIPLVYDDKQVDINIAIKEN